MTLRSYRLGIALWLTMVTAAAIPALTAMQDDKSFGAFAKQALKEIRGF